MNNKAQFTPLKKAVHVIPMLYAEAFAGSNNKEFVVGLYEDARLLETAAPAMYEALRMLITLDPRCHRGVTHCGECGACLGQAALAQAEGKHD